MKPATVMIVETNPELCNVLRHAFENRGYITWTCPAAEIAVSIFAAVRPNVVVMDLDLEGDNPLYLIDAWRELSPETRVFVECMRGDVRRIREAMNHGVDGFLVKPYALAPLFDQLEKAAPVSQEAA